MRHDKISTLRMCVIEINFFDFGCSLSSKKNNNTHNAFNLLYNSQQRRNTNSNQNMLNKNAIQIALYSASVVITEHKKIVILNSACICVCMTLFWWYFFFAFSHFVRIVVCIVSFHLNGECLVCAYFVQQIQLCHHLACVFFFLYCHSLAFVCSEHYTKITHFCRLKTALLL